MNNMMGKKFINSYHHHHIRWNIITQRIVWWIKYLSISLWCGKSDQRGQGNQLFSSGKRNQEDCAIGGCLLEWGVWLVGWFF